MGVGGGSQLLSWYPSISFIILVTRKWIGQFYFYICSCLILLKHLFLVPLTRKGVNWGVWFWEDSSVWKENNRTCSVQRQTSWIWCHQDFVKIRTVKGSMACVLYFELNRSYCFVYCRFLDSRVSLGCPCSPILGERHLSGDQTQNHLLSKFRSTRKISFSAQSSHKPLDQSLPHISVPIRCFPMCIMQR